jgi:hypothetical protein
MAKENRRTEAITPGESLDSLPQIVFKPETGEQESEFRRADLLQSVLLISGIDQVAESKLVREAVKNALGELPEIGE